MAIPVTVYAKTNGRAEVYTKKGPWKYPLTIRGPVDPSQVTIGHKYEVDLDVKPAQFVRDLGPNPYFDEDCLAHGLTPNQSNQEASSQAPRPQAQVPKSSHPEASHKDSQITATAVVKSCLEGGKDLKESFVAGCRWASLWGDLPPKVSHWWHKNDPAFAATATVVKSSSDEDLGKTVKVPRETTTDKPFNDDIPF